MRNLKLIFISILLIFLTSCGFEIVDKREFLNFNLEEISTSGDKRINFKLKNKLSKYNDTNSNKIIKIDLNTKNTKSIKEKNINNEITKYQIKVIVNVELIRTGNSNIVEFNVSEEGDYVVADKFSQTLNNEKKLINNIVEKISDKIIEEMINKLNVI
tara:strand:+ start:221 stop:694 length:474 start_codon:yes stop_codon:yes gene_type:complete